MNGDKELNALRTKAYQRLPKGVIAQIYSAQKANSRKRGHAPPSYSKEELKEWLYKNNFTELFERWELSGYVKDMKPSVDRIINSKPYSFSNIRLTTWADNNELGNKSKCKPVIGKCKATGDTVEFASVKEAETALNINSISNCLTCKAGSAGGYTWKYKEKR